MHAIRRRILSLICAAFFLAAPCGIWAQTGSSSVQVRADGSAPGYPSSAQASFTVSISGTANFHYNLEADFPNTWAEASVFSNQTFITGTNLYNFVSTFADGNQPFHVSPGATYYVYAEATPWNAENEGPGGTAVVLVTYPVDITPFTYYIDNNAAVITGYTGSGGAVVIPDTIGGYPVTLINAEAFYGNTSITSVVFGNNVTNISMDAFNGCSGLTNVTIPASLMVIGSEAFEGCNNLGNISFGNSLKYIGDSAFLGCMSLVSMTIPDSVTTVGAQAFEECTNLANVTIGSGVASIGAGPFVDCFSLTNISVSALNLNYSSAGGVLFNKSKTVLIRYPLGLAGSYSISNTVTAIGDGAFAGCTVLTGIAIPGSVTSVGNSAFYYCTSLSNVVLGDNVTNLGDAAFYSCSSLGSAVLGNGITDIAYGAFGYCASLTNVMLGNNTTIIEDTAFIQCNLLKSMNLPGSLASIGSQSFFGCGLRNVTIGNSVTNIGADAFDSCSGLTNVNIPAGVTTIGTDAFLNCGALTNISVNSNNPNYAGAGGVLFDKPITTLIQCPAGLAGDYSIPASVTSIAQLAFYNCLHLTSVTIPGSVTEIGLYAFIYCTGLKGAYFAGNAPSVDGGAGNLDTSVFAGDDASYFVHYLPGTTGWGVTFGGWATTPWRQPKPVILGGGSTLGAQSNAFHFTISWATNTSVVVLAATNLANPVWTPVITNTLTNGVFNFQDLHWTNSPRRFYRIRSP